MPKKAKWNEIPCPHCKEPAAATATKCPHCQSDFTPGQVAARKQQMKGGIGCGCAALIGLALSLAWCSRAEETVSVPETATASAKSDAIAIYRKVMEVAGPCDRAGAALANRVQSGDPITAYRAAEVAETECLAVSSDLKSIKVPISLGKAVHVQMTEALKTCSDVYLTRWSGARQMKEVLNGDVSVSKLADLQASTEALEGGMLLCGGKLMLAAQSAGASAADLGIK